MIGSQWLTVLFHLQSWQVTGRMSVMDVSPLMVWPWVEGRPPHRMSAGDLADWLEDRDRAHVRGAPYHPQTQGKSERWHQTLKHRILLENDSLPGALEADIEAFVEHCNHRRYHQSLNHLTPADVYFGRGQTILPERQRTKRKTIEHRCLQHRGSAA